MKALTIVLLSALISSGGFAQDEWVCGAVDTLQGDAQPIISEIHDLVIVLVDFPDGRIQPGNIVPTQDSDLELVENLNAVGAMGWIFDPDLSIYLKKVRKYTYEDYWDWIFSEGEYIGSRHPDYQSHNVEAYGSLREYYAEVSDGNLTINAYQTWRRGIDPPTKYNTGVVNRTEIVNGRRIIKWIMMPEPKAYYGPNGPLDEVLPVLDSYYQLGEIEFNRQTYTGRIMIVAAGGGVGGISDYAAIMSVREKRGDNISNQSVFDGIWVSVHEYGHTIGLRHLTVGSYDPMNYSLRNGWGSHLYSPPHFNALFKLLLGWIQSSSVVRLNTPGSVTIYPIYPDENSPKLAAVTIYGDAGRNNLWGHSEYFLLEYRKREGFNRFSGGATVPSDFSGGVLVWQYSSSGSFDGASDFGRLIVKVQDDIGTFEGNPGDPQHFYGYNGLSITPESTPNSNSRIEEVTGISLTNFRMGSSSATFDVQYARGNPPQYDAVMYGYPGGVYGGLVYMDQTFNRPPLATPTIVPGTVVEVFPSQGSINFENIIARGGEEELIIFRGVGYENNHARWGFIALNGANYNTEITFCRFENSSGLSIDFAPWDNTLGGPLVRDNFFVGAIRPSLMLFYFGSDPSTSPYIDGFDDNYFVNFQFEAGRWRCGQPFVVDGNGSLDWQTGAGSQTSEMTFEGGGNLAVYGSFNIYGRYGATLKNGDLRVIDNGTVNGKLTFTDVSRIESRRTQGVLQLGALLTVEEGCTLSFVGDAVQFNEGGLFSKQGSQLFSVPSMTFASYTTCDLQAGVTLSIRSGAVLSFSGALSISGNENSPVVYTAELPNQTWSGIVLGMASSSTINNCFISDAQMGISIEATSSTITNTVIDNCNTGMDVYTIDAHAQPVINDNEIRNCGTGLYFHQAFPTEVRGNHIHNNDIGIVTFQSSPVFHDNIIENNRLYGVWSDEADPRFGDNVAGDRGCNTIRNNTTTEGTADLFVKSGSAFFGFYDGSQFFGGFNSIFSAEIGEQQCIVFADYDAYVLAHITWWGQYPPGEGLFCLSGNAKIDYSWPLLEPPVNCEGIIEQWALPSDEEEQILHTALLDRGNRNYATALNTYNTFLSGRPNSPRARRALREMRQTYRDYRFWSHDSTLQGQLINSLSAIAGNHPNTPVRRLAFALWAEELHMKRNWNDAIAKYQQIAQDNPNTDNERIALYSLFSIYAYGAQDSAAARNILSLLQTKFPSDPRTALAETRFAMLTRLSLSTLGKAHASGEQNKETLPATYAIEQNYPNPFNPTTTIRYQLPEDVYVVLKVYDVLGREIATLVNETQKAGYYQLAFQATSIASGLYFYRLSTPNFTQVRKMLIIK